MMTADEKLEADWEAFHAAQGKRQTRTATNVLVRIEEKATTLKAWPDLAAAIMRRTRLEYGFTEENALDAERQGGFVAQYAARVEQSPAEVRPMLRLALAHDYLALNRQRSWWKGARTQLADATNEPPWSAERLVASIASLLDAIAADKDALLAQKLDAWDRLLHTGEPFARACRPTLWDFAVQDAVDLVGDVADDDAALRAKVLGWLDGLAAVHPVEKEPDAHVHALYRKLQLNDAKEADRLAFAETWFAVSAVSASAASDAASVLAQGDSGEERLKAHKIAERFHAKWPESAGGQNCLALLKQLEQPAFSIQVENQLLARGETLQIRSRNLTNLCFRLVPASLELLIDRDFQRAMQGDGSGRAAKTLEKMRTQKAAAAWTAMLEDQHDYVDHTVERPIPADIPLGYYVLFAATNDKFGADGLPCVCAPVSRTDLHLIQQCVSTGFKGFVADAETGRPRAGVTVEYWRSRRRGYEIFATTVSAADGSWTLPVAESENVGFVRACVKGTRAGWNPFASAKVQEQGTMSEDGGWRYFEPGRDEPDHVHLITDRALYRPGQTVRFKGYAYHADAARRDFRVIAHRRVFVDFLDVNRKKVAQLALVSNDFGSFAGEFCVPRDRLTGEFRLEARLRGAGADASAQGRATVNVEEYKRPKFTASFGKQEGLKLGAETKLWGTATTYTGLPVAGAKVRWTISRRTIRPAWWSWWHNGFSDRERDVASGTATTDETGAFVCSFVPTAPQDATDEGEPRYRFACRAQVTDASGEAHGAETTFTVGTVPWTLKLETPCDTWRTVRAKTDWKLNLRTIDDKPVAGLAAEVKVYALKQPERPLRAKLWRDNTRMRWEQQPTRDLSDPRFWEKGAEVANAPVKTDAAGEAAGAFALAAGVYRIEAVVTAGAQTMRDLKFVRVIDPDATAYAVREPVFRCFEKGTVRVGETARLFFGTGYASAYCRVRVTQGDEVLADEVREGANWVYEFPVTAQHRGILNFETTYVRENRLYSEDHSVLVPWDNLKLKITREHVTSKLLPDARETWRFRITGADTNEVRRGVEALAFMYDKSLDALREHTPSLPFDNTFTLWSSRRPWERANEVVDLQKCWGDWPELPRGGFVQWPKWQPRTLGLFERVSRGWRGGTRLSRALPAGAVCCEAAPDRAFALCEEKAGLREEVRCELNASETMGPPDNTPDVVLRKNLDETAFFLPSLVADANGVVEFSFTVPQALTGWKFYLFAHDGNLANGRLVDEEIVTVKPLMVEPNGPRFAREGDRFLYPVKVTNTDAAPQRGTVTLAFFDAESGKAVPVGEACAGVAFDLKPGEAKTFEFPVEIPDGCGYLRSVAKAAGATFTDGEEGFLPILSRRVMVQEALPLQIRTAGTHAFAFPQLKASGESKTLRHVGLAAQVVSDPTWYAFLALPYLMEYPHECNEQVFSRYYANALAAKIANADPAYRKMFAAWEQADARALKSPLELNDDLKQVMLDATPWVRAAADETRAKRHLGELFGSARLETEQAHALEKLRQNVASDDLWPWFPGGPGSVWVTMHILTGCERLKSLGIYTQGLDYQTEQARAAVDREMEKSIAKRLSSVRFPFALSDSDLRWLYLQSFGKTWNEKYEKLLFEHLEKEWTGFGIAGQSLAAITLLRRGNETLAKEIVKSLKERAVRSAEKGLYWKRATVFDCSLFGAPVSDQALAMEAFLAVEPEDVAAYEDARLWLLEQKRTQNWSSTVSTADAVYAILLGRGRTAPVAVGPVTMTLGGAEVPRTDVEQGTGFYECRYAAGQVKPAMGDITLARKEDALGWASVTWTYLEDAAKVRAFEQKDLRLTKTYYKKMKVGGKVRLVGLGGGEKLEPGDELVARLAIDSDRILEYVHLKDERPASAEPVDVISRYRWQDGLGFYQATRDTATHYYFDRLPKGNFVLETSFRVRQKGTFASGLATLECMYAPEFGAHSAASVVTVGQSGK